MKNLQKQKIFSMTRTRSYRILTTNIVFTTYCFYYDQCSSSISHAFHVLLWNVFLSICAYWTLRSCRWIKINVMHSFNAMTAALCTFENALPKTKTENNNNNNSNQTIHEASNTFISTIKLMMLFLRVYLPLRKVIVNIFQSN